MARSILAIAQEAAERDATAPAPTTLFGGTNVRVAKVLRTAANDVMRDFLRRTRYVGLSEFHSTWIFALQANRYAYQMPPDFLRMIPGTEQRNGWPLGFLGPATPQAWAWWLYGGTAATAPTGWRIKNNILWIEPTPTADELVAIEYVSRYPVVSLIRAGDYNLASEPLQTYAPIVPRDGWLELPNDDLVRDTTSGVFSYDEGAGWDAGAWSVQPEELLKRLIPGSDEVPLPQVRRPLFEADTDTPAFDDDHILSLGMTWHLQRAMGLPFAERAAEYEAEIESRLADDAGGARSFAFGCSNDSSWEVAPLGDGKWLVT